MFAAAKELPVSLNAFPFGQMHAAMRAAHHIFDNGLFLLLCVFSIGPDQQVNHNYNGNQ